MNDKLRQKKKQMKDVKASYIPMDDGKKLVLNRGMIAEAINNCTSEERKILCYATILPQDGMEMALFCMPNVKRMRKILEKLVGDGFLQREESMLYISPEMRSILVEELKPTTEVCGEFLHWYRGQYDQKTYDRVKFAQIASLYETASEILRESDGMWASEAGYLWLVLMESQRALTCNHRALALREQNAPNSLGLATAYNNLGSTYGHLGDHKKELEYQLKALAIREQVLPPTHPDLATSYNNVGYTYGTLGDHEKELEYQLKALGILEQSLPPDHPNIVIFRSNIAVTYAQMEDFIRANEYMRRALDSAERSMGNHPQLEMFRQMAQIMEICAKFQEAGMPLPFDNPFR